jgi:hypothetical protein
MSNLAPYRGYDITPFKGEYLAYKDGNLVASEDRLSDLTRTIDKLIERGLEHESQLNTISKDEIKRLMLEEGLTITDMIDVVIELNGIIGVGLITLGDQLQDYCHNHGKKETT